jgi:hypothetical protein
MSKTNQFLIFLVAFLCVLKLSIQCQPPHGWKAPTIEEQARSAPLVVHAKLIKKIPRDGIRANGEYTACLNVSNVYKGSLPAGDICASGFGDPVFCKTYLAPGVSYVVFLNVDPLSARNEFMVPGAVPYSAKVLAKVSRGVCCAEKSQETEETEESTGKYH